MPQRALRPCRLAGCGSLTRERYCTGHEEEGRKKDRGRDRRASARARGYNARWEKIRRVVLAGSPLCAHCLAVGITRPASLVDHIIPLRRGGTHARENLQPLCRRCHDAKTHWEQHKMNVVVVWGPPGSGKSRYVERRQQPGDLVVDMDLLFQALSGLPLFSKPEELLPFVAEARDAVLARLRRPSKVQKAWILSASPDLASVEALAKSFAAELVKLERTPEECLRNIELDARRDSKTHAKTLAAWLEKASGGAVKIPETA